MKFLSRIFISLLIITLLSYLSFWLFVRYGGEDAPEPRPSDWILPDKGADMRDPIDLAGPGNFRTIGGLRIDSNRYVKPGILFRSDCPSKYTREDWQTIESMGVKMVIDLRTDKETIDDPYNPTSTISYIHNPIYSEDIMKGAFNNILFERQLLADMMKEGYISMITDRASLFGKAINLISEHIEDGIIIHCTAGKDRTGILSALVLASIGVKRETIVYDYALSNNGFESNYQAFLQGSATKLKFYGIPPEDMKIFYAVDPDWLMNALLFIDDRYGTIENYLLTEAGVIPENLLTLKSKLIVLEISESQ